MPADATTGTVRLGMLTPSSNTVLEPLTAAMLTGVAGGGASAHFSRFRVVSIGLGAAARAQFDPSPVVAAAELLADAKVHAICWNGTSGAWLGPAADRALCAAIGERTGGIPATTATLALLDALRALRARRIALVTPYLADVQHAIIATLAAEGFATVAERHLDDPGNYSFAMHPAPRQAGLVREAIAESGDARQRPDAVVIHCTNFRGAHDAAAIEAETGVPVLDSVAVALWGALRAAGATAMPSAARWGRVFTLG
jgi:maleate isomerase